MFIELCNLGIEIFFLSSVETDGKDGHELKDFRYKKKIPHKFYQRALAIIFFVDFCGQSIKTQKCWFQLKPTFLSFDALPTKIDKKYYGQCSLIKFVWNLLLTSI